MDTLGARRSPARSRRAQDARQELTGEIRYQKFAQYLFDRQWNSLRKYCNDRGIALVGDIPIFVAHDTPMSGRGRNYSIWIDLASLARSPDIRPMPSTSKASAGAIRITTGRSMCERASPGGSRVSRRFFGFLMPCASIISSASIASGRFPPSLSAANGKWIEGPGIGLFTALRDALGNMPIIAEDLGLLTRNAEILRDRFRFPGMRILQFGFGSSSYHLPHSFPKRCVAYTGTHDNDTIVGWFEKLKRGAKKKNSAPAVELARTLSYLNSDGRDIHWAFIRSLMNSVADTVIFPVQDILGLGSDARMNIPGTAEGNWRWRISTGRLTDEVAAKLKGLVETFDRVPTPKL